MGLEDSSRGNFIKGLGGVVGDICNKWSKPSQNPYNIKESVAHYPKHDQVSISKPTIYMMAEVKRRFDAYIANINEEISGLGTVELIEGKFVITEIFLLEQTVSGASTDLDPQAVAKFMESLLMQEGGDIKFSKIKFWWHSHVNFGTFWSGQDESCISTISDSWFISMVGNKSGSIRIRLDLYPPAVPIRIVCDDLPLVVLKAEDDEFTKLIRVEISEKVKQYPHTIYGEGTEYYTTFVNGAEVYGSGKITRVSSFPDFDAVFGLFGKDDNNKDDSQKKINISSNISMGGDE
jgi:hypothetical protein